jgi:hypothetical protein
MDDGFMRDPLMFGYIKIFLLSSFTVSDSRAKEIGIFTLSGYKVDIMRSPKRMGKYEKQ